VYGRNSKVEEICILKYRPPVTAGISAAISAAISKIRLQN